MAKLFDRLLVSAPNGGGLFLVRNGRAIRIDNLNTTGIYEHDGCFLRAQQPDTLVIFGEQTTEIIGRRASFNDVHDVLLYRDSIYLAGTAGNEIIKFDKQGVELKRWVFSGEQDARHVNCLAVWNHALVFSAFGDFHEKRQYKGGTKGTGYVQVLSSEQKPIQGLSQPHSLTAVGRNLLLANSEEGEIREYGPKGNLVRACKMRGYTRGICVSGSVIYLGLSRSRNVEDEGVNTASIVALDRKSWKELGRLSLPVNEIYSLVRVEDVDCLLNILTRISSYSSFKVDERVSSMERSIVTRDNEIAALKQAINERDERLNALNQAIGARDRDFSTLNQAIVEIGQKIAESQRVAERQEARTAEVTGSAAQLTEHIGTLSQALVEREERIGELQRIMETRESQARKVNATVAQLEERIGALTQAVAARDSQVALFEQAIAERDQQVVKLHRSIDSRDAKIALLEQTVTARDKQVTVVNNAVAVRDQHIASLRQENSEQKAWIEQNRTQIAALEKSVEEQNKEIRRLVGEWTGKESAHRAHVKELENAVFLRELRVKALEEELRKTQDELNVISRSRLWRLTAPLRVVYSLPSVASQRLRYWLSTGLRNGYRALPMSPKRKTWLKAVFLVIFGFALKKTSVYRRWTAHRDVREIDKCNSTNVASLSDSIVRAYESPQLPLADGTWEWGDYQEIGARIREIKCSRKAAFDPKPLGMIDIGNEDRTEVAQRIQLPAWTEAPEVSIVVPVFNNLKLTLECLLSISRYSGSETSYEVIVADDASTDGTGDVLSKVSHLKVIRNDANVGFLKNCNNALGVVRGEYVLYLNNDVQVTPGWLRALLATFKEHDRVGAVGPRILYPSGHLQEAGVALRPDCTADMVGLNEDPNQIRFSYTRRVDYCSGACLIVPTKLLNKLGGFSEDFVPSYYEDTDLCLRIRQAGYEIYFNPAANVIHHLSKTTSKLGNDFKLNCISTNIVTLSKKWQQEIDRISSVRAIAFYLPQYHPIPENNLWWGAGFTEWTNVARSRPNFSGHYQPHLPADLGFYDLRIADVLDEQAELAHRYGIYAFCFYYYWFAGRRLLEMPIERMLKTGKPDIAFCLCWANENWTRRWDGQDQEILMSQAHSVADDLAVIGDLMRYFRDRRYVRIDGRPLVLVYRVTLFPNFAETAQRWRDACRENGIGEIYIAMVESFELVHCKFHPREFGCDAAVEFPPQGLADPKPPSGEVINPVFKGTVADYRDLAVRYATRDVPGYVRFRGVMPGWDNTPRRQNNSFCFENATPGAFQAWAEEIVDQTRLQNYGDERLIFVNAWNEWAEGAHLEPDRRFGHTYLEALKNALDAHRLLRLESYALGTGD